MIRHFAAVLALIILTATPTFASDPKIQAVNPEAVADTLERGKMLYEFDQAAWHSTDSLVALVDDINKLPIIGRVVVPSHGGVQAIYYGKNEKGRFAIFTGTWNGSKIVDEVYAKGETGLALSPEANNYANIVEQLREGKLETKDLWFCNKAQPNFALLPSKVPNQYFLYIMTAQEKTLVFPVGGHHRIDIKDGKVVAARSFTKSCIDLDRSQNENLEAFVISHLLDPIPTEIHVFTAIASKTSIFVSTTSNSKTWAVVPKERTADIKPIDETNTK